MKILIVCPGTPASGNLSTATRIIRHLSCKGITNLLCDPHEIVKEDSTCSRKQFMEFLLKNEITGTFLIHAYKCGKILLCSCADGCCEKSSNAVPCGIIYGGTDLNLDVLEFPKHRIIKRAINHASFTIAFNESLRDISMKIDPTTDVFIQPQAVDICDFNSNIAFRHDCTQVSDRVHKKTHNVFLMVTGIRPVKDPIYLLEEFTHWASNDNVSDLKLLIVGPVLDEEYADVYFKHLQFLYRKYDDVFFVPEKFPSCFHRSGVCGVNNWINTPSVFPILHMPPMQKDDLGTLMRNPNIIASVNSSESEGMSSAILEAMLNKIPVLARVNAGNRSLLSDGVNGLLFNSPKEFVSQGKRIIREMSLRDILVVNAYGMLCEKHSMKKEKMFYTAICRKYFSELKEQPL